MLVSEISSIPHVEGLYVVYAPETKVFKIGRTNNLNQRMKSYHNTVGVWGIRMDYYVFPCADTVNLEKQVLSQLEGYEKAGGSEYFKSDDIDRVVELLPSGAEERVEYQRALTNTHRMVYKSLQKLYGKQAHFNYDDLAKESKYSPSTIKRCMKDFLKRNFVEKKLVDSCGFLKVYTYIPLI